jgi:hypothetical protein
MISAKIKKNFFFNGKTLVGMAGLGNKFVKARHYLEAGSKLC